MMGGDPWDQDGLNDDDYAEGVDDEEEELAADFHTDPLEDAPGPESAPSPQRPRLRLPESAQRPRGAKASGKYRIRVMGRKLRARFPDVTSILITKAGGAQVLLVRKGN
jgi:hypothetical protein